MAEYYPYHEQFLRGYLSLGPKPIMMASGFPNELHLHYTAKVTNQDISALVSPCFFKH